MRSPALSSRLHFEGMRLSRPDETTVSLPGFPFAPPASPQGALFLRSAMRVTLASSSISTSRSSPSPPRCNPAPPEFRLMPQRVTRSGYSVSYTHLRAHETRHDLVC